MIVENNYLVFPVDPGLPARDVLFLVDGAPAFDLPMPLSQGSGKAAYIDVRRFMGREFDFRIIPACPVAPTWASEMPADDLYAENNRQRIHFTPPFGHMNDPNGLCFFEGKYHAFYQSYPASPRVSRKCLWYRQHWGHAVSEDLLNWELRPAVLFPAAYGCAWSGCAFVDSKNVSGLGENGRAPLLLYYTVCGEPTLVSKGKFHQRLAYSTDGGESFRLYPRPVVENIAHDPDKDPAIYWNRDPKVVWCEELRLYVMALFLGDGNYEFLTSDNLLEWRRFQTLTIPGDAECPDLYPTTADDGRRLWVFSGADHRYLIGTFEKQGFCPIQGVKTTRDASECYAGQTFQNAAEPINLEWLRVPYTDGSSYAGGFTLPVRRALKRIAGEYFLCDRPIDLSPLIVAEREFPLRDGEFPVRPGPCALTLGCAFAEELKLTVDAFGIPVIIDAGRNEVRLGDFSAPLSIERRRITLKIIYDVRSVELFADEGEFGFALCENCRLTDETLHIQAEGIPEGTLTVQTLRNAQFQAKGKIHETK